MKGFHSDAVPTACFKITGNGIGNNVIYAIWYITFESYQAKNLERKGQASLGIVLFNHEQQQGLCTLLKKS